MRKRMLLAWISFLIPTMVRAGPCSDFLFDSEAGCVTSAAFLNKEPRCFQDSTKLRARQDLEVKKLSACLESGRDAKDKADRFDPEPLFGEPPAQSAVDEEKRKNFDGCQRLKKRMSEWQSIYDIFSNIGDANSCPKAPSPAVEDAGTDHNTKDGDNGPAL